MMNERKLRYILEIAKEGSITIAAQNLFITQPSLSNLLISVEEELGTKLFDRSMSPMGLTYAGEKYVTAAEKILNTLEEFQRQVDDMNDSLTGQLNIGCGEHQSPFLIPVILPVMMKKYPGIHFKLFEGKWDILEIQLLKGALDIILYGRNITHPNIECIVLSNDEIALFTPLGFKPVNTRMQSGRKFPCIDLGAEDPLPFV